MILKDLKNRFKYWSNWKSSSNKMINEYYKNYLLIFFDNIIFYKYYIIKIWYSKFITLISLLTLKVNNILHHTIIYN